MGISVVWDDVEHTVIRWDFAEGWTWDEFQTAFEHSVKMTEDMTRRVDVIPYVEAAKSIPPSALGQFNRITRQMPPITGLVVITGGNTLVNAMISTFRSVYRVGSWRTASTLDEARALIQQDRAKSSQAN